MLPPNVVLLATSPNVSPPKPWTCPFWANAADAVVIVRTNAAGSSCLGLMAHLSRQTRGTKGLRLSVDAAGLA